MEISKSALRMGMSWRCWPTWIRRPQAVLRISLPTGFLRSSFQGGIKKAAPARGGQPGAAVPTFCVLGLSSEIQIGGFQRQLFRIDVGAIGQHDDRQVIASEALDGRAEAHGFAVMPHALVALIRI